jgi:hypothetical protein
VQQLGAGHGLGPLAEQDLEELERPRRQMDLDSITGQRALTGVEHEVVEEDTQGRDSSTDAAPTSGW